MFTLFVIIVIEPELTVWCLLVVIEYLKESKKNNIRLPGSVYLKKALVKFYSSDFHDFLQLEIIRVFKTLFM